MKKQSGFSALEIIMAIVIVGLLAAVGWLFYTNVSKKSEPVADTKSTSTEQTKTETKAPSTKTYTSTYLKLAFDYPADWTVKKNENSSTKGELGYNANGDKLLVVAPGGSTMFFDESKPDGLGGVCIPSEMTDFKKFGKTKLPQDSYVVGYTRTDAYYLYVTGKSGQDAAYSDPCRYDSLIKISERSEQDIPNIVSFGSYAIGEQQVSTSKPDTGVLDQAAKILLSLRKA